MITPFWIRSRQLISIVVSGLLVYPLSGGVPTLKPDRIPTFAVERAKEPDPSPGRPSVRFEQNLGQFDEQVDFVARLDGYSLALAPDRLRMRLGNQSPNAMMRLVGAEPRAVGKGEQPLADRTHYFLGNDPSKWQQNVPHFGKVRYEQVYPGIDLVYYDKQGQLEYDFVVAPGADPSVIELVFENVQDVVIEDGALILRTPSGEVRQQRPVVYQDEATKVPRSSVMPAVAAASPHEVAGRFEQTGPHSIRFSLGEYDPTRPLVIDPIVEISTLLGGAGGDTPVQVKVDQKGAVWVLGSTNSHDFTRADDTSPKGGASNDVNIFLSELTEQRDDQGQPFWTVETFFFGGSDVDVPFSFEFDPTLGSDQILISGETFSTDFVGAPGPEPQMPQGFLFGLTRTPSGESLAPDKGHNPTLGESFEEFLFFK